MSAVPLLSVALAVVLPPALEIDFATLPPARTFDRYRLTLQLVTSKQEVGHIVVTALETTPSSLVVSFADTLQRSGWDIDRSGDRVTVYGWKGAPVHAVSTTCSVRAGMALRWVPHRPPSSK